MHAISGVTRISVASSLACCVTFDRAAGRQVVLHDDAARGEQVDNLLVADAAVREHGVERRALRQVVAPIAFEHLRPCAGKRLARQQGALRVELDRDERGACRQRGDDRPRAVAVARPDLGNPAAGLRRHQRRHEPLNFRDRVRAGGHDVDVSGDRELLESGSADTESGSGATRRRP